MSKFRSRLIGGVLAATVSLVGAWEGLRTKAYLDPVKVPTICYGETEGVKMGQVKTVEECRVMLAKRLPYFEKKMVACLKDPESIPDASYIAFTSLTYNIGEGAFCKSTLVKRLNQGDIKGACNEISKWNRAGGRVLKGLTARRAAERTLCFDGIRGGASPKTVPILPSEPTPPSKPTAPGTPQVHPEVPGKSNTGLFVAIAGILGAGGLLYFLNRKK